jgi:hypothetical protein
MALVLTCACGARFELDDGLAGLEVPCPECQVLVKAPDLPAPHPRTSYWALASTVLALTGAFTVVGTVAAVGCGIIGLVVVLRQRQRVRGLGFALFGLVAGVVLTAVTVLALNRSLFENWGDRMRETLLADQIDVTGNELVVPEPNDRFTLTRPSKYWGRQLGDQTDPMVKVLTWSPANLTLVRPNRFAFVDVTALGPADKSAAVEKIAESQKLHTIVDKYRTTASPAEIYIAPEGQPMPPRTIRDDFSNDLELVLQATCNHRPWKIILRLCERNKQWYLVRGYVPEDRYRDAREEMTRALDSFRLEDKAP